MRGLALVLVPGLLFAAEEAQVRLQAQRSLALLEKVTAAWKTPCFSCHHQAMPLIALESARTHGLSVNETLAQSTAGRAFRFLSDLDAAVQVNMLIDPALSEGYTLLAAAAAGVPPSLSSSTYARHVARAQSADGSWPTFDARPPSSAGPFVATAVAARAISLYLPPALDREKSERLARARRFLSTAAPASTEDLTYRLLGLLWTGASAADRATARAALLAAQRPDGGWSQVPEIAQSDAYSTAQAAVALTRDDSSAATRINTRRAIEWLLRTQKPDGSWHVASRMDTKVPVSPPYFESGFPYGHDQYLSCAATAWAVMALAESLPRAANPTRPLPLPGTSPTTAPWMQTALFGPVDELRSIDPNAATAQGTTALMMASDDPAKVRLLLSRGARPQSRAASGYDALMTASLYPGNRASLEALLSAGLSPQARPNVRFKASALPIAIFTGDPAMVSLLLEKGANPNLPMNVIGQMPTAPLAIAVNMDHGPLIPVLIARGAQLDSPDPNGMTELSWAALGHKLSSLQALLAAGANPRTRDKFGLTPLEHTRGIRHAPPAAAKILEARLAVGQ